jgi:hypothetical protein
MYSTHTPPLGPSSYGEGVKEHLRKIRGLIYSGGFLYEEDQYGLRGDRSDYKISGEQVQINGWYTGVSFKNQKFYVFYADKDDFEIVHPGEVAQEVAKWRDSILQYPLKIEYMELETKEKKEVWVCVDLVDNRYLVADLEDEVAEGSKCPGDFGYVSPQEGSLVTITPPEISKLSFAQLYTAPSTNGELFNDRRYPFSKFEIWGSNTQWGKDRLGREDGLVYMKEYDWNPRTSGGMHLVVKPDWEGRFQLQIWCANDGYFSKAEEIKKNFRVSKSSGLIDTEGGEWITVTLEKGDYVQINPDRTKEDLPRFKIVARNKHGKRGAVD